MYKSLATGAPADALLFFGAKKIFPSLQAMVRRGAVVGAGDWHGEVRLGAEQLLERALNDDSEERNL